MFGWSPETWGDFGVVGILVVIVFLTALALTRGWIVPGPFHKEIIAAKDRELERANERSTKDAETIQVQAQTIADKNAIESVTTHLLQSFRESIERGA